MKYMLSTYSAAEGFDPATYPPEELREMVAFMNRLDQDLRASGELVYDEGLTGPEQTKTVRLVDGTPTVTDGPYAEAKEVIAGFWVVDVAGFDRAVEIASKIVDYIKDPIEIRPVGEEPQV